MGSRIELKSQKKNGNLLLYLKKHKRWTLPVMALLPSLAVLGLYIYVTYLIYVIFLIPIIIFLAMHFSDTWGFKKRLKYAIVFFVVLLVAQSLLMTPVVYSDPGTLEGHTIGDSNFTINISPYSGSFHNFTVDVTFNGLNNTTTFAPIVCLYNSGEFLNLTDSYHLQNETPSQGSISISHSFYNIPEGDYYVEVNLSTTTGKYNVTTGFVRGPILYPEYVFSFSLMLNYVLLYTLLGIVFVVIAIFSLSVSKSQRKVSQYRK